MASEAIQESTKGTHPTTSNFRTGHAKLCIINQSRQHMDFDKVSQSKERPNANRFYQENGFGPAVIVQFITGIQDSETGEFWNCNIEVKRRKLVIERGTFCIEVTIKPNGLVHFLTSDINEKRLPNYLCNVKCILPVEEDESLVYVIFIKLYYNSSAHRELLDPVKYKVATHEIGRDIHDYQEGRGIKEVERPQLKIKMTGILAEDIGRELIKLFQSLGDNGHYDLFYLEQGKLLSCLEELEKNYKISHFEDLKFSVKLEHRRPM